MQFPATASTELVTVLVAPALSCSRLTDKRLIPITAHVHSLYVSSCGARSQCLGTTWAHCISDTDVTVLKYFKCITEFDIEIEYYSVTYFKYI